MGPRGDAAPTRPRVRPTLPPQALPRSEVLQNALSGRPQETRSQVLHRPVDVLPVNRLPVPHGTRRDVCRRLQPTFPPGVSAHTTAVGSMLRRPSAPVRGPPWARSGG